ncbi:DUF1129 family protein [Cytobacillus gottheilii]|uniref:DUF1129 family protein n=1 Tax=Cytobacillus gottheilii TaxID=859144 RepID=UPI003CEE19B1
MNAKELIRLNNQKRQHLTKENEEYYENMLVYIRTSLSVSEQQSEELLLELLDHLVDAQNAGKSAKDVFGEDPAAYCKEMIKQLPKEPSKRSAFFIGFLLLQLAGIFAVINGIGDIIIHYVKDSDQTLYIGTAIVSFFIIAAIISLDVILIFKWLQNSIYKASTKLKDFFLLFSLSTISLLGIFFLPKWIPSFGHPIESGGFVYLIVGIVLLICLKVADRKYHITK